MCGVQVINVPPKAGTHQEDVDSEFGNGETLSALMVSYRGTLWCFLVKRHLTNAASIVQSSQPYRLFPTARAIKRRVTVATERLVRIAQMVIVLAALFWSPSGGGSPVSIRYFDSLSCDNEDDRVCFFLDLSLELKPFNRVRMSIETGPDCGFSSGCLPLFESVPRHKLM